MRLLLTILLLVLSEYTYSSDILKTRELYSNASLSENNCKKFGDSLFKNSNKSPIIKGYKGCYLMIKCKFTSNPIQKISYFNKGKSKIEKAIQEIDKEGIRKGRHSSTYDLVYNGKSIFNKRW